MSQAKLRLLRAAKEAGCTQDQIKRFLRAGYIPQPRQLVFHGAAAQADIMGMPNNIAFGGARGPGKTHAMICQMAIDDCQRIGNLRCLLLRKVGKAAKETMDDMRQKALMLVTHEWVPSRGMIRFPNGSSIILGHFKDEKEVEAYLGLEYGLIGVEEATTLSKSKWQVLTTVNRTSLPNWRPRLYSSTNPGGVGHQWYKKMFIIPYQKKQETKTRFIPATVTDNKFVNEEYTEVLDDLVGWQKKAWRYGDWDIAAGQFFTNFSEKRHVLHGPPWPSTALYGRFWCALDYGFTHYTAVYLLGETADGVVHVIDEHCERQWLTPRHAEAIKNMLARNHLTLKDLQTFVAGRDVFAQRGMESTIAEKYLQHGIQLKPANMSRIDGATAVLERLGEEGKIPRLMIYSRCARLISCLPTLEHDPHRPEDVLKVDSDTETGEGGDDPYDGFRYGIMEATGRKNAGVQIQNYSGRKGTAVNKRNPRRRR